MSKCKAPQLSSFTISLPCATGTYQNLHTSPVCIMVPCSSMVHLQWSSWANAETEALKALMLCSVHLTYRCKEAVREVRKGAARGGSGGAVCEEEQSHSQAADLQQASLTEDENKRHTCPIPWRHCPQLVVVCRCLTALSALIFDNCYTEHRL